MNRPTDDDIIAAVANRGGRTMPTYVIRNVLSSKHKNLETALVLRQLKRLEKEGKVERVPSNYAVMLCWAIPNQHQSTEANDG